MQLTGIPTWAALSTSGLRNLQLPAEVEEVIIAADSDAPGIIAAHDAARRWLADGIRVRIARPPVGLDFNDVLRAA
jgi:DNA primase